jgi:predicted RNA-binding Zn-ribbon protein involved in translation (DUF1610 family)
MSSLEKFKLLRTILHTIGLSEEATNDIVDRITDLLSEKDEKASGKIEYPYFVRDDFLSPAELSFYLVLKAVVSDWALVLTKVSLGDLFYVKSSDNSKYRTYTNKIDRKHIDYLLCDPKTVRPIVGIELDDKSHQRRDRQERDEFVEKVFSAAKLPLVRVPARRTYSVSELNALLQAYSDKKEMPAAPVPAAKAENFKQLCPKCGSEMILRTAKSGANQGEKFWGCSNFPQCRGIHKFSS